MRTLRRFPRSGLDPLSRGRAHRTVHATPRPTAPTPRTPPDAPPSHLHREPTMPPPSDPAAASWRATGRQVARAAHLGLVLGAVLIAVPAVAVGAREASMVAAAAAWLAVLWGVLLIGRRPCLPPPSEPTPRRLPPPHPWQPTQPVQREAGWPADAHAGLRAGRQVGLGDGLVEGPCDEFTSRGVLRLGRLAGPGSPAQERRCPDLGDPSGEPAPRWSR